jgi:hypothetical protein
MKKIILTLCALIPTVLMAQTPVKSPVLDYSNPVSVNKYEKQQQDVISNKYQTPGKSSLDLKNKAKPHAYVTLGKSYYDLQTNASIGNRVILHSDGTISAVWTASEGDATGWPERGSGYNHNDGSAWFSDRDARIEPSTRTGWPSIVTLSDGREAVIAHLAGEGGFVMSTNDSKGSTNFTTTSKFLDDETVPGTDRHIIWNRSGSGNGYIHLISNYTFSANVPRVDRNGVGSPTTYSRSSDDGATWDIQHALLPGYDSTKILFGGGDSYAIDVQDSVVAIAIGGIYDKVMLWKSTDNGNTFTYTQVDDYPYGGFGQGIEPGDTATCNDGSIEVILDQNNNAHVFYGTYTFLDADTSDGTLTFWPTLSRIMHWSEGMSSSNVAGVLIDMDGDSTTPINITEETYRSLDANDIPYNNLNSASQIGNTGLVTMPTASMDANGNLFLVYSAPIEGAIHFLNSTYRDVHVTYSTDGGASWIGPQNLTQDRTTENTFPCVAKDANDFLHVVFHQDLTPGCHLQNNSADGSHPNDQTDVQYTAVKVSDILNNVIGPNLAGEEDIERPAEVFVVSQNQPNPFNATSKVIIYLQSGSELNLTITDMLGNVVNQGELGILSSGNHAITLDASGLSSGMYFYTLSTKDHSITKKMQVN